jgi:membrane associated rhomboid family serine protease
VTVVLIVANVLAFWYELSLGRQLGPFLERWGLVPAAITAVRRGETGQLGALVTPLSAMFLHDGWLHLLGNVLYLWFFGRLVEAALGGARFLALYLAAGCAAGLAQVIATPDWTVPAIGASGGVAGLLGAYLPLRAWGGRRLVPPPTTDVLAAVLAALWLSSLALGAVLVVARDAPLAGSISWWGHLVGLIVGGILVSLSRYLR